MPAAGRDVERLHAGAGSPTRRAGRGPAPSRCAALVAVRVRPLATRRPSCRQLHRALGRLEHRRLDVEVRRRSVAQGCCGPRRHSCRRAARRSAARSPSARAPARIPRATSSQRVIPPKMLKKIERTWSSRVITSSASTTPWASPPPPRSQKFAGRPPATTTTSTVDIDSPAPLPRIPDLAVELDVGDALLAGERLERVGRLDVAHLGDVGVAEERVVVDRELGVERADLAFGRDDQRIDLAEHRVRRRRSSA